MVVGLAFAAHGALAGTISGRTILPGHTVPALKGAKSTGATPGDQQLQLAITLHPRNGGTLQTLLTELSDKHSPNYHHYLTSAQYTQNFGRSSAEVQTVESYLTSQGFTITGASANNLVIDATAPVSTVESALDVQIANYSFAGRTVYAPVNDPSVPDSIGGLVSAISGLDNVGFWQSQVVWKNKPGANTASAPQTQHPMTGSGHGGAYSPGDLRNAYDMNPLLASYAGTGQHIALVEFDGYRPGDISTYNSYYFINVHTVNNILVDGATNTAGADAIEDTLDMDVVSAVAPAATQDVYIAPNSAQGAVDLYTKIATDNHAKVISTSWALCEPYENSLTTLSTIFRQYAAQGQAVFASSGDNGVHACYPSGGPDANKVTVNYPASDPNTVGVGGTTLFTGSGASYSSETVWASGGGGQSTHFSMPTYQRGANIINDATFSNGSTKREVPDVSADADPNTGYDIYCSATNSGCSGSGAWYSVGGTSAAAPLWAGIAAVTNQYLAAQSKPTLGSATAEIYAIYNNPQSYTPYHDITSGNNGGYSAETNYDMASGIGSPDVWNFAQDAASVTPTSVARTWYFAEGYTGGAFTEWLTLANPNASSAHVTVTYLLGSGSPTVKTYTVNANARQTINVDSAIGKGKNVSMVVSSDIGIIAERPMYFVFTGAGLSVPGGTDVLGATALATQFDFGYVDTTDQHATYLTVLNQSSGEMSVTVSYYPQAGGSPTVVMHSVPAKARGTVLANVDVPAGIYSAQVALSVPGLVERPLYLTDATTGYTGSADVIGVPSASTSWNFAEGYSNSNFSERYILSNPSASATAQATVTFLKSDGSTTPVTVSIAPGALQIVSAASVIGSNAVNNSASVTSDQPIIAERFQSFNFNGIPGASDVIGTAQPGYWYGFAEGYTGSGFSEYLTLENPSQTATAYVAITYLPTNGSAPTQQVVQIAPHSRYTINTSSKMKSQSFSMVVESGLPIVAERPMYFNYNNSGQTGGSDVVGYQLY